MAEANYKAMGIIAGLSLGYGLIIAFVCWQVPPQQIPLAVATIAAAAGNAFTQLMSYLKSAEAVESAKQSKVVSENNGRVLNRQNETLEAIHNEAATAKVEAVATRQEASAAKEEIIEAVKSTQGQPGEL